ncbi:WD40 repeat domain-containing protein [Tautonia rosea]|uniref:WD40 repeat domain-containing protein n=1 Tax=Tautonia rosea TaxID=2728037 RepID=UPI0014727033|nr:hypothetical protein [Tautonia rosea]
MKRRTWLQATLAGVAARSIASWAFGQGQGVDRRVPRPVGEDGPNELAMRRITPRAAIGGGPLMRMHAVSMSPDGSIIAAAVFEENVFKTWDADGRELLNFSEHSGPIQALAFGADGRRILSASPSGSTEFRGRSPFVSDVRYENSLVKSWEASTSRWQRDYTGTNGNVLGLALAGDATVVALDDSSTLHAWSLLDGEKVFEVKGSEASSRVGWQPSIQSRFGASRDGRRAVSLDPIVDPGQVEHPERTISLWDADAGSHRMLDVGIGAIWSVAISPDGASVAAGGRDNHIKVIEFDSHRRVFDVIVGDFREGPRFLAFNPGGSMLVSGDRDGVIRLWETREGRHRQAAWGPAGYVRDISFLPDRLRIVSGGFAETGFERNPGGGGSMTFEPLTIWDVPYLRWR